MDNNNNNIPFPKDDETSTTVDWRGRPSNPKDHGGARAAAFVLGILFFIFNLLLTHLYYLTIYLTPIHNHNIQDFKLLK